MQETTIYLTKRTRLNLDNLSKGHDNMTLALTFNRNIETLGFTLSLPALQRLAEADSKEIGRLYEEVSAILRKMTGSHRSFKPMYPNFPQQVMEASDVELYMNAYMHYMGSFLSDVFKVPFRYLPEYETKTRKALPEDEVTLRVIHKGSEADFRSIFTALIASNSSLSETDKENVKWFVQKLQTEVINYLPSSIPQKENLALLIGYMLENKLKMDAVLPYIKTATDVLRIAVVMSQGDVSLAQNTKFKKFKRATRRFFLQSLENAGNITEDMLRRPEVWKRFGHILHPFEHEQLYPKTCKAFDVVFNDKPFATFGNKVETALKKPSFQEEVVRLLQERPGEFSRRLDHLLRLYNGQQNIIQSFLEVAPKVSTPVLLQTYNHFDNRHLIIDRAFFPKGTVGKVQLIPNNLPALNQKLCLELAQGVRKVLVDRFSQLPSLGNVYVEDTLCHAVVPFAQRSASKALRTVARGTRINLPNTPVARFFLWWKDGEDRTDIDLSTAFFDKNWELIGQVTYYNLREYDCYHSGDITSAPKGACEFIDVNLQSLANNGVRYAAMCLYSYTQQPYCDLPECFAGWMGRSGTNSGEIFEARTVQDKIDLTANTKVAVPVILDVQNRQVVWADLSLKSQSVINNVNSTKQSLSNMGRSIMSLEYNKPNLYDLFRMHGEARGTLTSRDKAETIFSIHEGITPYDIDKILSEYLA